MAVAALRRGPPVVRLPPARVLLALVLLAWGLGEAVWLEGTWPPAARIAFVVAVLAPIAVVDRWPWASWRSCSPAPRSRSGARSSPRA